ncbi:hypothetical protein Q5P01_024741 [Channa striata]|uniref:Ras-related protein Rab-14 n=2 Tax=Percomorphaceae TaxID=1489872 RepID=A0AA88J8A4_CHASR|nr:hypothetical protein Q5P01_024741 [Channa striata]
MTLHTWLVYGLGFILVWTLCLTQVEGLQCYGCNIIQGQRYVDVGCSNPEVITCTHSHKGFKHRFCIKTESTALGIVLTSGCATSRHCQQQELPGVRIHCCGSDLSQQHKAQNSSFLSHNGHCTVQLLLHLQIHNYRGHGGREVMFASPVHRKEIHGRLPSYNWCGVWYEDNRAGALMVYDITRRSTYNHLSSWLTDARNLTNPNTVIILIGNKADLEAQRDVTYEEAKQFAEENGLLFLEASAKTGENVEDAFLEAAKKIYQNIQDGSLDLNAAESGVQHKPSAPQGGRLTSEPQPQREGCGC